MLSIKTLISSLFLMHMLVALVKATEKNNLEKDDQSIIGNFTFNLKPNESSKLLRIEIMQNHCFLNYYVSSNNKFFLSILIEFINNLNLEETIKNGKQNQLFEEYGANDKRVLTKKNQLPRPQSSDQYILDLIKQLNLQDFVRNKIQTHFVDSKRPITKTDENENEQILNLLKVLNLEDLVRDEVKRQRPSSETNGDDDNYIITLITALKLEDALRDEARIHNEKMKAVLENEIANQNPEQEISDGAVDNEDKIDELVANILPFVDPQSQNGDNPIIIELVDDPTTKEMEITLIPNDSSEEVIDTKSNDNIVKETGNLDEFLEVIAKPLKGDDGEEIQNKLIDDAIKKEIQNQLIVKSIKQEINNKLLRIIENALENETPIKEIDIIEEPTASSESTEEATTSFEGTDEPTTSFEDTEEPTTQKSIIFKTEFDMNDDLIKTTGI